MKIISSETSPDILFNSFLEVAKDYYLTNCDFDQYYDKGICHPCSASCLNGCTDASSCNLQLDYLCVDD